MNKNKFLNKNTLLIVPYTIWMVGFIIIPLFFVIFYAFTTKSGAFTLNNILQFFDFGDNVHIKSFLLAAWLSFISTFICIIMSYPLALILKNRKLSAKSFIIYIFILPMWMNSLLRTYAWQNILERKGVINGILTALSLPPIYIINKPPAILLGMVYDFLPFMILPVYNSVSRIDKDLINAAMDLGAGYRETFFRVIWPLSLPGVISGITMVFVPSLTTFVISDVLGGGKILLIGNVIEQLFTQDSDWNAGAGLSAVLMIFIVISMLITAKYDREDIR